MNLESLAFIILSTLAVVSAAVVVFYRSNAVMNALTLAIHLISVAGFYFLLGTQFIGLLQVIVYAGAIMVLILFVIMLLNIQSEVQRRRPGSIQVWVGPVLAAIFTVVMGVGITRSAGDEGFVSASAEFGTVNSLGQELFTTFFYPFEAISLLLVVAMVGAVLLAKRRL